MLPNPAAATKEPTSPPKPVASPNALVTPISDDIELMSEPVSYTHLRAHET